VIYSGIYGFGNLLPHCHLIANRTVSQSLLIVITFNVPWVVCEIVGTGVAVTAICKICVSLLINIRQRHTTTEEPELHDYLEKLYVLRIPILFVLAELVYGIGQFIGTTIDFFTWSDVVLEMETVWFVCVFNNFGGLNGNNWIQVCGEHPSYRPAFNAYFLHLVVTSGQGILCSLMYLPNIIGLGFHLVWGAASQIAGPVSSTLSRMVRVAPMPDVPDGGYVSVPHRPAPSLTAV
jgi:hypothetical protein